MAATRLPDVTIRLIPKHGDHDCAIASIASYLGRDYEEVLIAASQTAPKLWHEGLDARAHVRICRKLGIKAQWTRTFDPEDHTGVLWVDYHDRAHAHHSVLLVDGKIYDSDHDPVAMWDCDDFMRYHNAYPVMLLRKVEG